MAWTNWEYCNFILHGKLFHHRITTSSNLLIPLYPLGWRETIWSKVSCRRKQQSEYSIPTLRSEALQPYHFTTALPPLRGFSQQKWSHHLTLICYLSCISYEIAIAIKDRQVGLAWVMKNITTILFQLIWVKW